MNFNIRNEHEKDYFAVENLTREAFWNIYHPGCNEHLLVHNLRDLPCFIKELDFVAESNGEIIGHIIYSKSILTDQNQNIHEFASFGPISVHPEYQKTGIGKALIEHSLSMAKELGFKAIFITGNTEYYHRFGFETATDYGIHLKGTDANDKSEYFMVKLLEPNALDDVSGIFEFDPCFDVDEVQLEQFEKLFPKKIKEKRPGQLNY